LILEVLCIAGKTTKPSQQVTAKRRQKEGAFEQIDTTGNGAKTG